MGTDISGWVEVAEEWNYLNAPPETHWDAVVLIDSLVGRSYDMFGLLFGVTNYANLPPVVAGRSLPPDTSDLALEHYCRGETCAESWILWSEIASIDWSVDALDGRPHRYERAADGTLVYESKAMPLFQSKPPEGIEHEEGNEWERDGAVYRFERVSRADVFSEQPDWKLLFAIMERLAECYGQDKVRLVVWFDREVRSPGRRRTSACSGARAARSFRLPLTPSRAPADA